MQNDTNDLQGGEREEWESWLDSEDEFIDWINQQAKEAAEHDGR